MGSQYWYGREDAPTVVLSLVQKVDDIAEARRIVREEICVQKQKLIKMKGGNGRLYKRGLVNNMKMIYGELLKIDDFEEAIEFLKEKEMDLSNIAKIEREVNSKKRK
jgi:hypothetical protein